MMANVAQLVNNLHALFLSSRENCIVTPTYHIFDMYQGHQGAVAIRTAVAKESIAFTGKGGEEEEIENLSVSASYKDDVATVTIANLSAEEDMEFCLVSVGAALENAAEMKVLADSDYHAHNTFEEPERVKVKTLAVDLNNKIVIPKAGVVMIRAKIKELE